MRYGSGMRFRARAAGAALALGAATASFAAAVPAAGAATKAPCTRAALQKGLSRGTAKVSKATVGKPFGCDGKWAYAAVNTKRFTATSLFRAQDGRWVTVKRSKYCANGSVPKRIFKPACQTN